MLPALSILANFLSPEEVGTTPQSMFFLLPLVAAIAVVYKATKLPAVTVRSFVKESSVLFGSIVVFILVTAVILYSVAWLITE